MKLIFFILFLASCSSDPFVKEPRYKNLNQIAEAASAKEGLSTEKVLEQVSVLPSDSDPITYEPLYRVTLVEKGSVFEQSGVRPGDIVTLTSAPAPMVKQRSSGEFPGCPMEKLDLEARHNEKDIEVGRFRVHFSGAARDGDTIFEAASVYRGKKKICDIDGGIYSGAYSVGKKNQIVLEEYSGSCGSHRLFDVEKCRTVGKVASYCGSAVVEDKQLLNDPPCEGNVCGRGKVWDIDPVSCRFVFNDKASGELTRKVLGLDLPQKGNYEVSNKGTKEASRRP